MAKSASLFSAQGIKDWLRACRFTSDKEASEALDVAFRTFGRWKAFGLPVKTPASAAYSAAIVQKMKDVHKQRNAK